jgi:hypothetical protein
VAIPSLSLVGSLLAFSTFAWWISFAPVTVGVLIHELYHHAAEYRRLSQEHSARQIPSSEPQETRTDSHTRLQRSDARTGAVAPGWCRDRLMELDPGEFFLERDA